ncbi:MAG TPA: phosphohydrolase, partial [Marinobacter sp.]|nr:phosphohydrolase [Marinobacter sp.]
AEGDYYFAGRGFGQGLPSDCCTDSAFQRVDVSAFGQEIDAGKAYLDLSAQMTTWSADDIPKLRIELRDANDQPVTWNQQLERTSASVQSWESQSIEGFLPANVRSVIVYIGGERTTGNDNDVYFDSVSLSLLY